MWFNVYNNDSGSPLRETYEVRVLTEYDSLDRMSNGILPDIRHTGRNP